MRRRAKRGRTAGTAVRLALFAAACLLLTGWLAVRIGNIRLFAHNTAYAALLSDASGLQPGDAVEIAGVRVGQVGAVTVQHGSALVSFDLDKDVRLRASTGVGIRWLDVLGDKVLSLYPGSSGAVLVPGATLPLQNDVADASVGALLDALSPFLGAIDPQDANRFVVAVSDALDGNEATVGSLLDNASSVATTLGNDNAEIGAVIDEYQQVAGALASHSGDVAAVLANLGTLAHGLAAHDATLDAMVGDLAAVTRDLGGLLVTNRSEIDGTIDNVDVVAETLQRHLGDLAASLRTLPSGLAPYEEISAYGQWFQIQVVYSCIAAETVCSYYQPTNQPGGSPLSAGSQQAGVTGSAVPGGLAALYGPLAGAVS